MKPIIPAPVQQTNGVSTRSPVREIVINGDLPSQLKPRKKLTIDETDRIQKAIADIDDAAFSDVEVVGFYDSKQRYLARIKKRTRDIEDAEGDKRKVRLLAAHVSKILIIR